MADSMSNNVAEHVAVERLTDWTFQSKNLAERMGNTAPIAYGGYAISLAVNAAAQTVPEGYHLYSEVGHYLGPASTTEKMVLAVTASRSTRTFQTRRVQVLQKQRDGSSRLCMEVLADFQRAEPALFEYSAPPTMHYTHWRDCLTVDDMQKQLLAAGRVTQAEIERFNTVIGLSVRLFHYRYCPEGIAAQTLLGLGKQVQTTQEHLPITSKTSGLWLRARQQLQKESDQVSSLAFILDGFISFLPLVHSHMFLEDAAACSSLDFAFRVFTPNVDLNQWHLWETVARAAGHGRTYSEARLWDERGNLVASMTQQSIMRPHQGKL